MNIKDFTISTQDGRKLKVSEWGQPDGVPILAHHGTPGSRLLYRPWVEDARSRGIRLISYDRPGYGESTPQPGRNMASAAEDATAIAQNLNLDRLCVWGFSAGGPFSLACAAQLPNLVVAASAIGSSAPYDADGLDWFEGMGEGNIAELKVALKGRETYKLFVEEQAPAMLSIEPKTFGELFSSILSPVDVAVLTQDYPEFLVKTLREGSIDSLDGWIDDGIALVTPWGFELSSIETPVLLLHGAHDRAVPISHGEWLADNIGNVEPILSEDEGHLTLAVGSIPKVHAWLLDKWNQHG